MATTTGEQQAKLERFVALDALATFLANLGSTAAAPPSDNGGRPLTAIPELDRALAEAMDRLSGDLAGLARSRQRADLPRGLPRSRASSSTPSSAAERHNSLDDDGQAVTFCPECAEREFG
jgi:hypothetical protein